MCVWRPDKIFSPEELTTLDVWLQMTVTHRGVHPQSQWCIYPCFRFSPISDKFPDSMKNFANFTFSQQNFSVFIRRNFWWPFFLVIDSEFRISPYKSCIFAKQKAYISPYFGKLFIPPTFFKLPPDFVKFTCFYVGPTLRVFRFPLVLPWCIYASHNARRPTGRPYLVTYKSHGPVCSFKVLSTL